MKQTIELHRQHIPRRLLVIDAIGAVLVAIGVLDLVGAGPQLVPTAWQAPAVSIGLIVVGCLVMLPVPVWLLRQHRRRHDRHRGEAGG